MKSLSLQPLLGFVATLAILSALALSTNSCSNSTTPNNSNTTDTIHLVSIPNNIVFPSVDSSEVIRTLLTCGCPFKLNVMAAGGEQSAFIFQEGTPDSTTTTPHTFEILVNPSATPHMTHAAWFYYSAVDHFGKTQYDTLRFSVTIP